MNELVKIKKIKGIEDVFTDSLVIAKGTNNQHESITALIRKYKNEFKSLGPVDLKSVGINGTNSYQTYYLLNEPQATFLMTLLRNNEVTVAFKLELVKEFFTMRQFLRERQSSEWKETRIKGKLCRRNERDIMATVLFPLAISQGSKHPEMYYKNYATMVNDCVGIPSNSRDKATKRVLEVIYNLENLIEHIIKEEAKKGTYYKDIYKICKDKCNLMVELSYLPMQRLIA